MKDGDTILLIGRRRRATYARVATTKAKKKGGTVMSCAVSANMATNLRLRNGDKVKVVPLGGDSLDETHTGDMALLSHPVPPKVVSVTFAPVEDSLQNLSAREGGDEISDEDIMERFIKPYLANDATVLIKKDHLLALVDDNGKRLEVMVTHVELEGGEAKEEGMSVVLQPTYIQSFPCMT